MNKPRHSWRTVSLRTLFLLMLACGCMLGMIGREQRQSKRRAEVVQELSKAASKIDVEYVNFFGRRTSAPPPAWQASILGESYFQHVTGVVISDVNYLPLEHGLFGELRDLRSFELNQDPFSFTSGAFLRPYSPITFVDAAPGSFTDQHAEGLRPLRRLENIVFSGAPITDNALKAISPRNPLRSLYVARTQITDHGAEHIGHFDTLETLDVSSTWITDGGLEYIARLPRLKNLTLSRLMVSDEGLRILSQSPSLETLTLSRLAISLVGLKQLARLPKLKSVQVKDNRDYIIGFDVYSLGNPLFEIEPPSPFWALEEQVAPHGVRYLRWLLEHGADPNAPRVVGGISPLAAFVVENDLESVEVLLAHGADVNQHDDGGRTPLSMASERGQLQMMQFLLAQGAEPHPAGAQSAVCSAAATGQLEAIKLLAEHGADVTRPNHHGHTPLEAAIHYPRAYELLVRLGDEAAPAQPCEN